MFSIISFPGADNAMLIFLQVWMRPCSEVLWWVHNQPLRWKAKYFQTFRWTVNSFWQFVQHRWIQCNWNKTWTRTDSLDPCAWVQCTNPPQVKCLYLKKSLDFLIPALNLSILETLYWRVFLWFQLISFLVAATWGKPYHACMGRVSSWLQQQRELSLQDWRHLLWVRRLSFCMVILKPTIHL